MPKIHLIAAQTRNRVIGRNNGMPWHLPQDLKHFKATTSGYPIIMGRKTYESLGKALPNRVNHVVSRQEGLAYPDARTHFSLSDAIKACEMAEKVFIIGGGQLYQSALPIADELNITWIDTEIDGDTYFPEIGAQWQEIERSTFFADMKNKYNLDFVCYRKSKTR